MLLVKKTKRLKNTLKKLTLLIILALYCTEISFPATENKLNEEWRWTVYTSETGLPSDYIYSILETPSGLIWAATSKGYAYFDDYYWHSIEIDSIREFPRNIAISDGDAGIIAIYSGELLRISRDGFTREKVEYAGKPINIDNIALLSKKELLILAERENDKRELFVLKENEVERYPAPENSSSLNFIHRNKNGELWASAKNGLYKLKNGSWVEILKGDFYKNSFVSKPESDSKGKLIFSIIFPEMTRGTWKYKNPDTKTKPEYDLNILSGQLEFSPSDEAIAFYINGEIKLIKPDAVVDLTKTSKHLELTTFYKFLSNGDLMIGTAEGLYLCRLSSNLWEYYLSKDIIQPTVHNIIIDKSGSIWSATMDGINIFHNDGSYESIKTINGKKLFGLTGLHQDKNGDIWISSGSFIGGAFRWDGSKWHYYDKKQGLNATLIHKITEDRKHRVFFLTLSDSTSATGNGVFIYDDGKFIDWGKKYGFKNKRVYDFLEDDNGAYWFATVDGISRFNKGKWRHWKNTRMSDNGIFDLALAPDGKIWYASRLFGIGYLENNEPTIAPELDMADIYPVYGIDFDNGGILWISTRFGLYCYNNGAITHFNRKLGLLDLKLWPLLIDDKRILVGTERYGINALNTEHRKEHLPIALIEHSVAKESGAFVQWKALSYRGIIPSEQIETRYKINDGEWSIWSKQREANFYDLSPGLYTLKIQAKNLFGFYDSNGISVKFIIPMPYYMNPAFLIMITGLILVSFLAIILFKKYKQKNLANKLIEERNFRITLSKLKLEEQNSQINEQNEKLQELNATKDKFFSIIAHDLINPFNSFLGNTRFLSDNYSELEITETSECIRDINSSAENMYKLLQNLLQWANTQQGKIPFNPIEFDVYEVASTNAYLFDSVLKDKNIKLISHIKAGTKVYADYNMVDTVFRNLISNAIKFTPKGGLINLNSSSNGSVYEFSVVDSGIGISSENLNKLFRLDVHHTTFGTSKEKGTGLGLIICREFIEKNGGKIWVESEPDKGSRFNFILKQSDNQSI